MSAESDGEQSAADIAAQLEELQSRQREQAQQIEQLEAELEASDDDQEESGSFIDPGRRGFLKGGLMSAVGVGGILSATGGASAGTAEAGTIGNSNYLYDWYVEDLYDKGDNNPMSFPGDGSVDIDALSIGSVSTVVQGDSELTDAINNGYKTIYLRPGTYSTNRTISNKVRIVGLYPWSDPTGAEVTANWTFDASGSMVENVRYNTGTATFNGNVSGFRSVNFYSASVNINGDFCFVTESRANSDDVTFGSGTSGGIVDSCRQVNVVDNGANYAGDIA